MNAAGKVSVFATLGLKYSFRTDAPEWLESCFEACFQGSNDRFRYELPVAPNLLSQNFTMQELSKVWVSGITYVRTGKSWLYLCVILDLANREVVGWQLAKRMDARLVVTTLPEANSRRSPRKLLRQRLC